MKTLLISLILLLSLAARGQTLPIVVDNSQYFPPVIDQQGPSCTHVSLIYYLKSAIWNRQFNRDPKLPENQFSYGFVWNQNVFPELQTSSSEVAAFFMKDQGCATVADFPLGMDVNKPFIDHQIREKALRYKTKESYVSTFGKFNTTDEGRKAFVKSLKDSLVLGKCFTIDLEIFSYFYNMKGDYKVYSKYSGMSYHDSTRIKHAVVIVGYNDTIKTAEGRGAFKAINSSKEIDFFYLDYNWFFVRYKEGFYDAFLHRFLSEDFESVPKKIINLEISGAVTSQQVLDYKFSFVPQAINQTLNTDVGGIFWPYGEQVDFLNYFYYYWRRNYVQMISYNNQKIPLRQEEFLFPMNQPNGHYYLIKDISHLGSQGQLKTVSVIVLDPIAVKYIADDGATIYSYTRTSNIKVEKAFVSLIDSGKKIYAKVLDLPDTTMVVSNFYSWSAGFHLNPQQSWVHVKSCTSTVKRKLVTFSVDYIDNPPEFTSKPVGDVLSVDVGTSAKFQFTASDTENQPLSFSIIQGQGGSITSAGLFSFFAATAGDYAFTVRVSDGINYADYSFSVKASVNQPPVFTSVPSDDLLSVWVNDNATFQFAASDPEGKTLTYALVSTTGGAMTANGLFSYRATAEGKYYFLVTVSDGKNSVEYVFFVEALNPPVNHPPRFDYASGNVFISLRDTFTFAFRAIDQDGHTITYSLAAGSSGTINPTTGEFSFTGTQLGIFTITVVISDGLATAEYSFVIQVDIPDAVEGLEDSGFSFSAYPNPVNSQLSLEFSLPVSGNVLIEIIDISGKVVGTIAHEFYGSGVSSLRYDTSYLKSGVYFCRLNSGKLVRTFKLVKQ